MGILLAVILSIFILFWIFILLVKISEWHDKRKERKLGYRVEFVSENVLRDKPNQFAVVYHQGGTMKCFYGEIKNHQYILDLSFPYADKNDERIIMQQRIIAELKRKCGGRIKITT